VTNIPADNEQEARDLLARFNTELWQTALYDATCVIVKIRNGPEDLALDPVETTVVLVEPFILNPNDATFLDTNAGCQLTTVVGLVGDSLLPKGTTLWDIEGAWVYGPTFELRSK